MNQNSDTAVSRILDRTYPLETAQLQDYRTHGYIRLKNVLDESSLSYYGKACTQLVDTITPAQRIEQARRDYPPHTAQSLERYLTSNVSTPESTYSRAFVQVHNLWRYSTVVEQLVRSRRLARIATELMGTQGTRLYHDQALYKQPFGGHTPWHVDQYYWPLSSDKTITAWIPLQAVSADMGPLAFAKGSHTGATRQQAGELAISDESEARLSTLMKGYEIDDEPFDLGEVSFHSGWTCHRADANNTDRLRAAFTIIYMDRDIRTIQPEHPNHKVDLAMWMPGIEPAQVAASHLNPVLYELPAG